MNFRRFFGLSIVSAVVATAPAATIDVAVDRPGAEINPAMWGVFFEDINFGADGGLYAELVKNRGFEFPDPLMGWSTLSPSKASGQIAVRDQDPFNPKNPHYVRITSTSSTPIGLANEGFRGVALNKAEAYDFNLRARRVQGTAKLRVQLYGGDGAVLDTVDLPEADATWQQIGATLHPNDTDAKSSLALLVIGEGTIDVDFVSLFPQHTWKNRKGGLRADMVQALADFHPGFLRFPGGCIVEGSVLSRRYQWKQTLGPVEERPLLINRWNYEFLHRPAPDYFQSFGLGFFEYFQLCEDIGAQPLPILNCGMACQFNSGELCAPGDLDQYIQDALDLIEFANAPATTEWGAKRAALGHPEPFNLRTLGVGNEQWGESYFERYARFAQVLKAKHPEIALVSAAGPEPADERFKQAWAKLPALHADIIDEHCYARPDWFFDNAHRYDSYARTGPKVFMGEYAAQSVATVNVKNRNTFECALAEAAFMTGLERNADVVRMASYAPLFANVHAWQWTPDMIWADGLRVMLTPNYHVQRLFAVNRGDRVLTTTIGSPSDAERKRLYASATWDSASRSVILKLVNATGESARPTISLHGAQAVAEGTEVILHAPLAAMNTMDDPTSVAPQTRVFTPKAAEFAYEIPANAFVVLRLPIR